MRLGCISSTSTLAAISASSFGTSTTGFPFMSMMASWVRDRKVLDGSVARSVSRFSMFRSVKPSWMNRMGSSEPLVKEWYGANMSTSGVVSIPAQRGALLNTH